MRAVANHAIAAADVQRPIVRHRQADFEPQNLDTELSRTLFNPIHQTRRQPPATVSWQHRQAFPMQRVGYVMRDDTTDHCSGIGARHKSMCVTQFIAHDGDSLAFRAGRGIQPPAMLRKRGLNDSQHLRRVAQRSRA